MPAAALALVLQREGVALLLDHRIPLRLEATTVSIGPAAVPPTAPVLDLTHPACTVNTGTITVTGALATGYEYQLDASGSFGPCPATGGSGLAPGSSHTITVRSNNGKHWPCGCTTNCTGTGPYPSCLYC